MPGPRFIRYAQRIHAYGGAVAALIHTELAEAQRGPAAAPQTVPSAAPAVAARPAADPGARVVGSTRAELMMSEELSGLISFGTA